MIYCHCQGVTQETVLEVIREGAATVEEVSARCGAGLSCSPCREGLRELIATERATIRRPPIRIEILDRARAA